MSTTGVLYVVATPIGNMQDLTLRAQDILTHVDLIAAEDTRHSRYLLNHFSINTPLMALHEHNEQQATQKLLAQLQQGKNIALISDAGTPLISDPGSELTRILHAENIKIVPIPGASAVISALSVAGFPADQFIFAGFIPPKENARRQFLETFLTEIRTTVFYEAPHRILSCITAMEQVFGDKREIALVKELTKLFETIYRAPLSDVITWLEEDPVRQKGEFVIVLSGATPQECSIDAETQRILNLARQQLPLKKAAKLVSDITGISKNQLYQFGVENEEN